MCRLFGLRANQPADVEFSLATGPRTMRHLAEKHPDGWGIGWYKEATPAVRKEPISAAQSQELPRIVASVYSPLIITHVRKATTGDVTVENCHPFQHQKWLFAHNGQVDRDALLAKLESPHRAAIQGQTDSEVFFHWILQSVEQAPSVPDGLRAALNGMSGFSSLNFLLADGATLYAYRNASKTLNYYSLFYLRRDPQQGGPEELRSTEVQALLRIKAQRGEKAVLVCSERLTKETWNEIPLGNLLVVAADLSASLVEVK